MKFRDVFPHLALLVLGVVVQPCAGADTVSAPVVEARVASPLAPALERIAATLERRRQEQGIPGVALAIVKDDKVIMSQGFGVRDVEKSLPVTPDTLFRIGSTTKAFTAMLAEMSVDDQKLALDDSPQRYLPYFKLRDQSANGAATLRDFLAHRSGFKRTDLAWSTGALNREEVIQVLGQARPTVPLRGLFQYNNVGYSVVGEAVAKAQGTSWENLIAERIFAPLAMKSSLTSPALIANAPDFTYGYRVNPRERTTSKATSFDTTNIAAATGLVSSATDMAQWLRLMLKRGVWEGQALVSGRGYDEMVSPQMKISSTSQYGLGWYLETWRGHRVVRHGGTIASFRTEIAFMPDEGLGFVMLANASSEALQSSIDGLVWSNLVEANGNPENDRGPRSPNALEMPTASRDQVPEAALPEIALPETALPDANQNTPREGDDFPPFRFPPDQPFDDTPNPPGEWAPLVATYRSTSGSVVEIAWRNGRLMFVVPSGKAYPLMPRGGDRFALAGLSDGFALRIQRDAQGQAVEVALKQPVGDMTYAREPDFEPPLTVDELMARVIAAAGGEANLRRHPARVTNFEASFENEGVSAEGTFSTKAPASFATDLALFALGKPIGTVHEFFQDSNGGVDTNWNGAAFPTNPSPIFNRGVDCQNALADQQLLEWKTMFKTIVIKRLARIGSDITYVVEKTPFRGSPITDYISTNSFRLLKRESPVAGWVKGNEIYSDYRTVEGVAVPFRIEVTTPRLGDVVIRVKSVRLMDDLPATDFESKKP